jgi:hypothetical protein
MISEQAFEELRLAAETTLPVEDHSGEFVLASSYTWPEACAARRHINTLIEEGRLKRGTAAGYRSHITRRTVGGPA